MCVCGGGGGGGKHRNTVFIVSFTSSAPLKTRFPYFSSYPWFGYCFAKAIDNMELHSFQLQFLTNESFHCVVGRHRLAQVHLVLIQVLKLCVRGVIVLGYYFIHFHLEVLRRLNLSQEGGAEL